MIDSVQPSLFERMVALRRDLHRHPELAWEERRTTDLIGTELDRLGLTARALLHTGLVADLAGPPGVPIVALRADLDALPIQEETGLPYASEVDGVMHACGHDAHVAMLLVGSGARAMVEAGALEGVGAIFGGHVDRHYPTGTVVAVEGTVNASTDSFRISISGQQGHAARPHETVDAIVVGSLIVMAVQTIVSREIDPSHPSVVSIGRFEAGSAANVIAGTAVLEGTIRAQEPEVQEHLKRSILRVCESMGQLHQARIQLHMEDGTPPLVNRGPMVDVARSAAEAVLGPEHLRIHARGANMGGEDFSWYLQQVPGCYVRLGARLTEAADFPSHSSRFQLDEDVLAAGAAWFAEVARQAGTQLATEVS
jgi:metal-dependent amidase/aminoacylase/carboxypeptidase family protein